MLCLPSCKQLNKKTDEGLKKLLKTKNAFKSIRNWLDSFCQDFQNRWNSGLGNWRRKGELIWFLISTEQLTEEEPIALNGIHNR